MTFLIIICMLEPTYNQAMTKAWQLVRHHKSLWILGLLSVLLGQFGITNFIGQIAYLDKNTFFTSLPSETIFSLAWWQPIVSGWSIWLMIIVVAVLLLVVVMATAAEGALIAISGDWYKQGKIDSFDKAWHKGVKHFWRLLSVKVVERALLAVLLGVVGYLLLHFIAINTNTALVAAGFVFAAGFLLALLVSTVAIYASGYIVQDENSFFVALNKARLLFARHVLVSLELSIVQFVASIGLIILIVVGGFWLLAPSVILSLIAGFTGFTGLISFGIYLTLVLFVVLVAVLGGIFNAWVTSSWIFLFMKMHREGVVSRVMHWFAHSLR